MASRNTQVGRAGEYYVASVLEMAGIEATKLDGTFDLLAVTPAGTIISVEVKTRATVSYSDDLVAARAARSGSRFTACRWASCGSSGRMIRSTSGKCLT